MGPEEWLQKSLALYGQMKDLAAKQQSSIVEDRLDAFHQLARERDRLRAQIDAHEKRPRVSSSDLDNPDDPRHEIVQEKIRIIRSILETDKKTEEMLLKGRSDLLAEIRSLRKGRTAVKGYNTRAPKDARFFDGQG